jgi:hypothetical protein
MENLAVPIFFPPGTGQNGPLALAETFFFPPFKGFCGWVILFGLYGKGQGWSLSPDAAGLQKYYGYPFSSLRLRK